MPINPSDYATAAPTSTTPQALSIVALIQNAYAAAGESIAQTQLPPPQFITINKDDGTGWFSPSQVTNPDWLTYNAPHGAGFIWVPGYTDMSPDGIPEQIPGSWQVSDPNTQWETAYSLLEHAYGRQFLQDNADVIAANLPGFNASIASQMLSTWQQTQDAGDDFFGINELGFMNPLLQTAIPIVIAVGAAYIGGSIAAGAPADATATTTTTSAASTEGASAGVTDLPLAPAPAPSAPADIVIGQGGDITATQAQTIVDAANAIPEPAPAPPPSSPADISMTADTSPTVDYGLSSETSTLPSLPNLPSSSLLKAGASAASKILATQSKGGGSANAKIAPDGGIVDSGGQGTGSGIVLLAILAIIAKGLG